MYSKPDQHRDGEGVNNMQVDVDGNPVAAGGMPPRERDRQRESPPRRGSFDYYDQGGRQNKRAREASPSDGKQLNSYASLYHIDPISDFLIYFTTLDGDAEMSETCTKMWEEETAAFIADTLPNRRTYNNNNYGGGGGANYNSNYGNSNNYNSNNNYNNNYNQRKLDDPATLDYLVSFRQFCEYARFKQRQSSTSRNQPAMDLPEEELRARFAEYKEDFHARTLWTFFSERKKDEWFIEKYHPTESKLLRASVNARKVSESSPAWVREVSAGKFDTLSFDASANATSTSGGGFDFNFGGGERENRDDGFGGVDVKVPKPWDVCALFMKNLPAGVKRSEIVDACKDYPGYKTVLLSDPRSDKNFIRFGWIVFNEGTDLEAALTALNGKAINEMGVLILAQQVTQQYRTRVLPYEFSTSTRLELDLSNVRRLARSLDVEAGIDSVTSGFETAESAAEILCQRLPAPDVNAAASEEETAKQDEMDALRGAVVAEEGAAMEQDTVPAEPKQTPVEAHLVATLKIRLDMLIEYVRRVHWYDYYSGIEADGPEDFSRRAWIHLRNTNPSATNMQSFTFTSNGSNNNVSNNPNNNNPNAAKGDFTRLSDRLDTRILIRTTPTPPTDLPTSAIPEATLPQFIKLGGKDPEAHVDKGLEGMVSEVDEEKYRCAECSKLFRGREFVKKHLRAKHDTVVEALKEEVTFYNNYVKDPNRVHYVLGLGGPVPGGHQQPHHHHHQQQQHGGGQYGGQQQQQQYGGYGGADRGGGGYYGDRRGGGGGRGRGRDTRNMPVDPRARKTYDDLDVAPVGAVDELNYD
ncbi:arsenite-resistance protein 2-domain-containing protein [Chytriomyces cf. hyalinus JEL632]|nr:arsenite-resistance protein 2-domain-containing protein [Chytriomyces cf. hyalinus JEL632]